ncbi:hypothetical protein STSP2_03220 [Anaerohalosphaera lusitana]|uniref:Ada DNA repair metal-binding domain-containing protein n=1 Tax=Anaerohalosphaera lusitana TaxID=1936003 RepID=A0A1U9NQL8_9BACT|nr:Ada metal-binding domain-containing protein [Anaerohalosphaera lusitana]AQT70018.1 hypothetical protein STSP2_03220 [Anaerohalosphaera lusitana]
MSIKRISLLTLIAASTVCIAGAKLAPGQKNYGNATVKRFIQSDEPFVFTCDIDGFPPVVGKNIPVRIAELAPPAIVAESEKPNLFYNKQLADFITEKLSAAKKIELKGIRRGTTSFQLVADVYIDGQSLAWTLIKKGLARHYVPPVKNTPAATGKKEIANTTGPQKQDDTASPTAQPNAPFIASKSSKIFHKPTCRSAKRITDENRVSFNAREQAVKSGRRPCRSCSP